jgi:metal-responsive CopG/Arc/MetJ family transcriptional regulator
MKTAVSIPDAVFRTADHFARQRKLSRSALFTQALKEFLALRRSDDVTERLNRVYAASDSTIDQALRILQSRSIPKEPW